MPSRRAAITVPQQTREDRLGLRSDYAAARSNPTRRQRRGLTGGSADTHLANERDALMLIEASRDMCRNDVVVGCTLEKAVAQCNQGGFTYDPDTGDKELDRDLKARWTAWADDPDACSADGEHDFNQLHDLARLAEFRDGDVFALGLDTGHLQLVEADRLRTPEKYSSQSKRNIVLGIELDGRRQRKNLFVSKEVLNPRQRIDRLKDADVFPFRDGDGVRQVFQLYDDKRATQTRGVSVLHAVFTVCDYFEDTTYAAMLRNQLAAAMALFIERDSSFAGDPTATDIGEREQVIDDTANTLDTEVIRPGAILRGLRGEKPSVIDPKIQAGDLKGFLDFLLQLLGMNLGLPLGLVKMEASKSFSGWRGEFDQAKIGFRRIQQRDVRRWHRPILTWKLHQWMDDDAALRRANGRNGVNVFGHKWRTVSWPYIEPLKDAMAKKERLTGLLTSFRRSAAEDGVDFEDIYTEQVQDMAAAVGAAIDAAKKIRDEKDGVTVQWRDLLHLQVPKGSQVIDFAEQPNVLGDEPAATLEEAD